MIILSLDSTLTACEPHQQLHTCTTQCMLTTAHHKPRCHMQAATAAPNDSPMLNSVPVASRKSRYRKVISATHSSLRPKAANDQARVVFLASGTATTFLKYSKRSTPPATRYVVHTKCYDVHQRNWGHTVCGQLDVPAQLPCHGSLQRLLLSDGK